jgi:hypothetical protein
MLPLIDWSSLTKQKPAARAPRLDDAAASHLGMPRGRRWSARRCLGSVIAEEKAYGTDAMS